MTDDGAQAGQAGFARALGELGPRLLAVLAALEAARRALHPPTFGRVQARLRPIRDEFEEARRVFEQVSVPSGLDGLAAEMVGICGHASAALGGLIGPGSAMAAAPDPGAAMRVLEAMHRHHRAEAALFALRRVLPPVNRFFFEPACHEHMDRLDPDPPPSPEHAGFHRAAGDARGRGGFLLYVPEWYDDVRPWPLVVALHGGSGHGDDFLWTWIREARSRGFLLLAPTSRGSTWGLHAPEPDAAAIRTMVEAVSGRLRVDGQRVLLTGLSDGATFALLAAATTDEFPFTALAPVSGVLHPLILADPSAGERLRGRRVHLVHGALDWMFPVALAREAAERLSALGVEIVYHEIDDLSHTWPREENDRILRWFDPQLAPAGAKGG